MLFLFLSYYYLNGLLHDNALVNKIFNSHVLYSLCDKNASGDNGRVAISGLITLIQFFFLFFFVFKFKKTTIPF